MESLYQSYKDRGFIIISLMGENNSGQAPSPADLQSWASTYGLTHPVVADANWQITSRYLTSNTIALPSMHLLAPGAEVVARDTWITEQQIEAVLPD